MTVCVGEGGGKCGLREREMGNGGIFIEKVGEKRKEFVFLTNN